MEVDQNAINEKADEIKDYIIDAYRTWDPPLEFVCLMGDVLSDPLNDYNIPCSAYGGVNTDNQYAVLEGGDQIPDIVVGRLSADSHTSMEFVVTKTVRYEQNPFTGINWYDKGYLLAGTTNNVATTMTTMEHIRQQMYDEGFTEVVLHTHAGAANQTLLQQQFNQGRAFFFHRPSWTGQISASYANGLANGWMLPYGYIITCGTNGYATGMGIAEAFLRYGSVYNGGGMIGCSGSSTSGTHTRYNNLLAAAISDYFMIDQGQIAGVALVVIAAYEGRIVKTNVNRVALHRTVNAPKTCPCGLGIIELVVHLPELALVSCAPCRYGSCKSVRVETEREVPEVILDFSGVDIVCLDLRACLLIKPAAERTLEV